MFLIALPNPKAPIESHAIARAWIQAHYPQYRHELITEAGIVYIPNDQYNKKQWVELTKELLDHFKQAGVIHTPPIILKSLKQPFYAVYVISTPCSKEYLVVEKDDVSCIADYFNHISLS